MAAPQNNVVLHLPVQHLTRHAASNFMEESGDDFNLDDVFWLNEHQAVNNLANEITMRTRQPKRRPSRMVSRTLALILAGAI